MKKNTGKMTASEGRRFGLTVGTAFLVFAAIAWWRGHPTTTLVELARAPAERGDHERRHDVQADGGFLRYADEREQQRHPEHDDHRSEDDHPAPGAFSEVDAEQVVLPGLDLEVVGQGTADAHQLPPESNPQKPLSTLMVWLLA